MLHNLSDPSIAKTNDPLSLALIDSNHRYHTPPHLTLLNDKLIDVAEGRIKFLMVFMPPRHAKSETISKYFTSWFIGTYPEKRVILTSYEADFAATWGYKSRNILEEHGADFDVNIDNKSNARNRWDIQTHGGGMVTAGVGGPITGKGGHILIIDDPVKNAEEANSETMREKAWDWYTSTFYTRREPGASIILIMTRWHEDDLAGRLLERSDDPWEVISLPALAEENDPLGRDVGEALWPERYPVDELLNIKRELGSYWFSALYQQRPQPATGGLLKREWLDEYDTLPRHGNTVKYQGWDMAISEKTTADYTCSCTLIHDTLHNKIYITDWTRDHIDFPKQVREVREQYQIHNPSVIGFEDVAYQRALPQQVQSESDTPLPIRLIPRVADKVARITTRFSLFENGTVYVNKKHPLYSEFEREFVTFNQGVHDDLLDATELALGLVMGIGGDPYTDSDQAYDYTKHTKQDVKGNRVGRMHRRQ